MIKKMERNWKSFVCLFASLEKFQSKTTKIEKTARKIENEKLKSIFRSRRNKTNFSIKRWFNKPSSSSFFYSSYSYSFAFPFLDSYCCMLYVICGENIVLWRMNTLCFNNDGNSISSKTLKSRPLQTLPTFYIIFNSTDDGINDFLIFVLSNFHHYRRMDWFKSTYISMQMM